MSTAANTDPLVRVMLFSPVLIDVERIGRGLDERGNRAAFEAGLKTATRMPGATFFFSAADSLSASPPPPDTTARPTPSVL